MTGFVWLSESFPLFFVLFSDWFSFHISFLLNYNEESNETLTKDKCTEIKGSRCTTEERKKINLTSGRQRAAAEMKGCGNLKDAVHIVKGSDWFQTFYLQFAELLKVKMVSNIWGGKYSLSVLPECLMDGKVHLQGLRSEHWRPFSHLK